MKSIIALFSTCLGVTAALVGGGVLRAEAVANRVDAKLERTSAAMDLRATRIEDKVESHREHADANMDEFHKDLQALYQFMLTKQRQSRLEK